MTCPEASRVLGPWLDDELDVRSIVDVEGHLLRCADCAQEKKELLALRRTAREQLPRFDPPPGLQTRLLRTVGHAPLRRSRRLWRDAALMLAAACATLVATPALRPPSAEKDPAQEIVDAHVRSLQAQHLIDVTSSDPHTVKPWFQGRIDFSVPSPDFSKEGFALAGGRLDVLSGHPVAALVYRRRQHLLNLFVSPVSSGDLPGAFAARGYRVSSWTQNGLQYRLVSDLPASEDERLISLLRAADSPR